MEKIQCRVCKKYNADFMDYNICEECENKNMKKFGIYENIMDGRTKFGKPFKKIAKVADFTGYLITCGLIAGIILVVIIGWTR